MVRASSRQQKTAEAATVPNGKGKTAKTQEKMEVNPIEQSATSKKSARGRQKAQPEAEKVTAKTNNSNNKKGGPQFNGKRSPNTDAANGSKNSSTTSSPVTSNTTENGAGRGRKRPANDSDTTTEPPKSKKVKVSNVPAPKVSLSQPTVVGGVVLTVGMGDIGQLGLGPDVEQKTRVAVVPGLPENVVAISAGGLHSVCLDDQGKVYTWGCNDEGALGRITGDEDENFSADVVEGIAGKVVQVSAGDCHSAALTEDGTVFAWGNFRDNNGPLGFLEGGNIQKSARIVSAPGGGEPMVKVASGNNHFAMLAHSGRLYTCGCGESGQLGRLAEMFASRDSRNRNGFDVLLLPDLVKVFRRRRQVAFDEVWAGGDNTFARCADTGTVYAWGLNNYNQMGDHDTNTKFQPTLVKALKDHTITQVTCGQHHALALNSEGEVYAMGRHDYGRLGLGEDVKKDAVSPTKVTTLTHKITHVSAAGSVSLAVAETGKVFGFGMGTSNQLSQGGEDDCWEPTAFTGKQLAERTVVTASLGGQHTLLLATAGKPAAAEKMKQ